MKWYKLFSSKEEAEEIIPIGKTEEVIAGHHRICLAHSNEGFFAVKNECPHAGASLATGFINTDNEIICPWHAYRFNLNNGEEADDYCPSITVHLIEFRNDGMYIGVK